MIKLQGRWCYHVTGKILRIISVLLENDRYHSRKKSRVFPALRIISALLCIVLASCSKNAGFTLAITAFELLRTAFLPVKGLKRVIKRVFLPAAFASVIVLPSLFIGSPSTWLTVTMKVVLCLLVLSLMNEDLSWKEITGFFSSVRFPAAFTMTLDMTVRYLALLSEMCQKIYEAYLLRAIHFSEKEKKSRVENSGKSEKIFKRKKGEPREKQDKLIRQKAAGGILGTVFLKSEKMGRETAEAMECRCFDGRYMWRDHHKITPEDFLYSLLIIIMIILFAITQVNA